MVSLSCLSPNGYITNESSNVRSLKEIRDHIPSEYFVRDTARGLRFLARDIAVAAAFWTAATFIDPYFGQETVKAALTPVGAEAARWAAWGT